MNDSTRIMRKAYLRDKGRADELKAGIAAAAAKLDARYGNPPGVALRGIYFWFYPPEDVTGIDVLENLHADAIRFVAAAAAA
jgi:hypothetical protein